MPTIYSVRIHHKFNRFRFYLNFECFAIISRPLSVTVLFLGNAAESFVCRPEKITGFCNDNSFVQLRHWISLQALLLHDFYLEKKLLECKQNLRFGGDSAGPISLFLSLHLTDRLIVTWNGFNRRQASSLFLQLHFFLVIMLTSLYICAHSLSRAALSRSYFTLLWDWTSQIR